MKSSNYNDEVKRICEKYGIETVEKEGYPVYMGEEMDENFSFSEMMRQSVNFEKVKSATP